MSRKLQKAKRSRAAAVRQRAVRETAEQRVARVGFDAVCYADPGFPVYMHSVGLTDHGIPEFVLVGNYDDGDNGDRLLNLVVAGISDLLREEPALLSDADRTELPRVVKLRTTPRGELYSANVGWVPVAPERLASGPGATLTFHELNKRYGPGGYALRQVVIPDRGGRLPWHEGWDVEWETQVIGLVRLWAEP